MSESYFYWKPKSNLGEVSSGSVEDAVGVSGYLDAEPYVVPSGYMTIIDGKRVEISGAVGDLVYMGVNPEDYPMTEDKRQRRTSHLTKPM